MSIKAKVSLIISVLMMILFIIVHVLNIFYTITYINLLTYTCFAVFTPFFYAVVSEHLRKSKDIILVNRYITKLNSVLIEQSHNSLFYDGDLKHGAQSLTKSVTDALSVDRCSVWLYNAQHDSIICDQLYVKSENAFYQGIELFKQDYLEYFEHLAINPIIIADDAETHPATACFKNSYLKILGIKSMLDVPILYKGKMIGVMCVESCSSRKWSRPEIDFAQMLSSIYSFVYSVKISNSISKSFIEIEKFIDDASLISKADANGKITYVNRKFTDVSGWSLSDAIGKDHSIVNSGYHPKDFWKNMYSTVIKERKIWNAVVTNKAKDGKLYYVDTYIKAEFDDDSLLGFTSIRQDFTDVKKKEQEIRNRMLAINRSNAVIEFDLNGTILYANDLFLELMEYSREEITGKSHKNFVGEEYLFSNSKSNDYKELWNKLRNGEFVTDEFMRITKSGKTVWLQASYNPIIEPDGTVKSIMKIATNITKRMEQSEELEKKNTYLEHAAKILRHDMHSGINTYIPRGISSLERRLTADDIKNMKLEAPLKLIKEGLKHTQKVYKGVYEFTNLVKTDVVLSKTTCSIQYILDEYLSSTSYKSQVELSDTLPTLDVNESLFCTALDNLIRNGLKYNDSESKVVRLYSEGDYIYIVDNGRGMTQEEFEYLSKPYVRKEGQRESGSGLGLNICKAILQEHGFSITSSKLSSGGTELKIKIK